MPRPQQLASAEKRLEILHDHYKETFARVVHVERTRDRLFLLLIVLFALLALEIGYPASFSDSVDTVTLLGAEIKLDALPLPAVLNATWVFALAIALSYARKAIWVNRQYDYVHDLEDVISPALGAGDMYRREGYRYTSELPLLINVAWIAYVFVFPVTLVFATIGLVYWEVKELPYAWFHKILDIAMAICLILVFFFYQVQPHVWRWICTTWGKCKDWQDRRNVECP